MKKDLFLFCIAALSALFSVSCADEEAGCAATCQNGGECVEDTCHCPVGFTGLDCSTEIRAPLLGTFITSDYCAGGGIATVTISPNSTSVTLVDIYNLGGFGFSATAAVSQNPMGVIIIDMQGQYVTIGGTPSIVSGEGVWGAPSDRHIIYHRIVGGQFFSDCEMTVM